VPIAADVISMRPLRGSIRLPTGIVAPPVSRVRLPDEDVDEDRAGFEADRHRLAGDRR
jgi:hypothetical protein